MRYRPPREPNRDPYKAQPLPIEQPVAVYYRQSSEAQIGNISTTLQTVDMVEHLVRLGWMPERVLMIDMDAGISGTKKINERPGMSQLFQMIEKRQVGAVAAQDVDRFFRDVTQIETNIFIDACRRNNVLVLTPSMVFDFAHPTQGRYHMQMFRDQAQRAADYLEYQIKGRLVKARLWRLERGMWGGRKIAPGYMVDNRPMLPDGTRNPHYQKYVPCPVYAEIVRTFFELFHHYNGAMSKVGDHIDAQGPFYPEDDTTLIPEGFIFKGNFSRRSPITGQFCPGGMGLYYLLTNVVYIGHWMHQGAIVIWDNHEAIVPHDLFMYSYNRLSETDFHGEPNPDYAPYKVYRRQPKHTRNVERPTYSGLIFSDDVPDMPHKRVSTIWRPTDRCYNYKLTAAKSRHSFWSIKCDFLDETVDAMLLERLQATTLDEQLWQTALAATQGDGDEIRHWEGEIKREKAEQDNVIASLRTLTHPDMVRRAQAQYEAAERRIAELTEKIAEARATQHRDQRMLQARPALQRIAANWQGIPPNERRNLFQAFAHDILVTRPSHTAKIITVRWKDGTESRYKIVRTNKQGHLWQPEDIELLRELIDRHASQTEIMQTFPTHTWRGIRDRYKYHFGMEKLNYHRTELTYSSHTRWIDTEESLRQTQSMSNVSSTTGFRRGGAAGHTTAPRSETEYPVTDHRPNCPDQALEQRLSLGK